MHMRDLHAISSYGPTAGNTRVRLNDWFRFLKIDATHHYYAGPNNNCPASMVANSAAVGRPQFALRRLDLSGQGVIVSREASPFSRGDVEARLLHRAVDGVRLR